MKAGDGRVRKFVNVGEDLYFRGDGDFKGDDAFEGGVFEDEDNDAEESVFCCFFRSSRYAALAAMRWPNSY